MNEKEINQLLLELYTIDASLRQHEAELKKVIARFLAARPQAKINDKFRSELRQELLKKAGELKPWPEKEDARGFSWVNIFTVRNLAYTTAGAALVVMLMVFAFQQNNTGTTRPASDDGGAAIERLAKNAFGDLSFSQTGAAASQDSVSGYGGGGTAESAAPDMAAMPYLGGVNYNYVYDGEISLDYAELPVYKKVVNEQTLEQAAGYLKDFGSGFIDLATFDNSQLQNFAITEDAEYGYTIDCSLNTGYLTISPNNKGWFSYSQCTDEVCSTPDPLSMEQVPADETLIAMADSFMDQHGIDLSSYGSPTVDKNWLDWLSGGQRSLAEGEAVVAPESVYVPDSLTITYPLTIAGYNVYNTYGETTGIQAQINLYENKVFGAYNIGLLNFQSSDYDLIADSETILDIASQGGLYEYPFAEPEATYDVALGEPYLAYVTMYQFTNNVNVEYFVPALVFPVTGEPPVDYFYKERVIVPLVAEFSESAGGGIVPMLKTETVETEAAPSAEAGE